LTSKLILTAAKSLLDAAAKAISFEEFRNAAHVERITIPFPEKQGQTQRSAGGSTSAGSAAIDEKSGITVNLHDGTVTAINADKKILWQMVGATKGKDVRSLTIHGSEVELGPDRLIVLDLFTGKMISESR
jgi:hypothetical protein